MESKSQEFSLPEEPEIIGTGHYTDIFVGTDASKPVQKKLRVEVVQIGLNPSNIKARILTSGNITNFKDVQLVDELKAMGRQVPDDVASRVSQYHKIRDIKFTKKYMPAGQRRLNGRR